MSLDDLHRGFRAAYLDYESLTAQLEAWAKSYPELCRLSSLGTTPEGRSLWLLRIGRDLDRTRPAAWIDGNMHASELAGSSVALGIAEDALRLHVDGRLEGVPAPVADRLKEIAFYVLPRISPDGAEHVLRSGRFVRSVPRDQRPNRAEPRWISGDVNGDGLSLLMRVPDPAGEFVESKQFPGVMLERRIDDEGPFYKIYPEGTIEHFDGRNVPAPRFLDDNPIDLNRNFPYTWAPPHQQIGAGPFAASEPEARALVEFASAHPEIFAWLNLHTYGGVAIRPLGDAPDTKMDPNDLAIFRQIADWLQELTGYPTVSGYEEFLYEPDKPLRGDLSDYAYHHRGAIAYVIELWDLFARLGLPRPKRFVDYYESFGRDELHALARWDRDENDGRLFRPWQRVAHPQLGDVEVGGLDARFGLWNPPVKELARLCETQSRAFLRVAALAPSLTLHHSIHPLEAGLSRVDVSIENHGYLPTTILENAKGLDFAEPVSIDCEPNGSTLVDPGQRHVVVGHLEGWGRGLRGPKSSPHYTRSSGSGYRATVSYLVQGRGELRLRAGSCRVGWIERTVAL